MTRAKETPPRSPANHIAPIMAGVIWLDLGRKRLAAADMGKMLQARATSVRRRAHPMNGQSHVHDWNAYLRHSNAMAQACRLGVGGPRGAGTEPHSTVAQPSSKASVVSERAASVRKRTTLVDCAAAERLWKV